MVTSTGHYTGAKPSPKDKRDFKYSRLAGAFVIDWEKGYDIEKELNIKLPTKDQGQSFSCGGQAWSYYGDVLTALKIGDRSAKFIYSQTAAPGGGSTGRDNSSLVKNKGWASEMILTSYIDGKPPTEAFMTDKTGINDTVLLNAAQTKAVSYALVNTDIDSIAQAIILNKGCVIGITGENNGTWLSSEPKVTKTGTWAHWLYAGKLRMKDGRRQIGVKNSWGNIGDNGWQWLDEAFFSTWCFEAWTLIYNLIPHHAFYIQMKYGDSGPEVSWLQKCLRSIGYLPGDHVVTDYYGPKTRNAVFAFQKDHCITDVWSWIIVWKNWGNNVGELTIKALNKLFT